MRALKREEETDVSGLREVGGFADDEPTLRIVRQKTWLDHIFWSRRIEQEVLAYVLLVALACTLALGFFIGAVVAGWL